MSLEKISVTGGKGGTGKSTVSILLANQLRKEGKKVVLVDADVECPNDHLLLGQKLTKPWQKIYAQFPQLDKSKCRKCGLCVQKCRSNAIFQAPGQYPAFIHELCSGCGLCWHLCPHGAIKVERKIIGQAFKRKVTDNFWLVTGQSVGVVDETGPIVTEVRKRALKFAQKVEAEVIIFDTSVGLHCGVIRALIGVDSAYAVTEPTPLGAHDLELILNLLRTLKVPTKVVLNQADLGRRDLVDKIVKKMKVEIVKEIPYSQELVKLYSRGELLKLSL